MQQLGHSRRPSLAPEFLGKSTASSMDAVVAGTGWVWLRWLLFLTMAAYLQSLAEALAITDHYEVSLDVMLRVLLEAPTSNGWLKSKMKALQGEKADTSLDIETLRKDVVDAVATGAAAFIASPRTTPIFLCSSSVRLRIAVRYMIAIR